MDAKLETDSEESEEEGVEAQKDELTEAGVCHSSRTPGLALFSYRMGTNIARLPALRRGCARTIVGKTIL